MKPKTIMLLAVAVGSGLLAMLGVQQAMSRGQVEQEDTLRVLVALDDIGVGERFTDINVEFRELPVSALPEDPVTSEDEYLDRSPLVGIVQDDIIRVSKLSEPGVYGKSVQIPEGMRVVSIPVDDTHNLSGLLQPGDRIDLLVTYSTRGQNGRQITKNLTLLEYIEVFSTDDKTATEANQHSGDSHNKTARHVALLLTPEQANLVKLAQAKGTLAFAWRNKNDDQHVSTKALDEELLNDLKGDGVFGHDTPAYAMNYSLDPEAMKDPELASMFDQPKDTPDPTPEPQDVQGFLDNTTQAAVTEVDEPEEPNKNIWNVKIYLDNEPIIQEFELPEETPDDSVEEEATTALLEAPQQESLSDEQRETPSVGTPVAKQKQQASGSVIWKLLRQVL